MIRNALGSLGRRAGLGPVLVSLCFAALAALAAPAALGAQNLNPKPDSTQAKPTGPTELVFVREVFTYPHTARRNPFTPLTGANQGGPRYEQLRLMGIIYDDKDPSQSVAMFGTSQVTTSEDSTSVSVSRRGQTFYKGIGETAGNIRVVEIHPTYVVVEVDEFGIATRKVMRMDTGEGNQ